MSERVVSSSPALAVPSRLGAGLPERTIDQNFQRVFTRNLRREHDFEPLRVEGTLPACLHGTLYRNGAGLFTLFDGPAAHLLEGDGAMTAVRLERGRAWGACRVTESNGLRRERAAGRRLYGRGLPLPRRVWNALMGQRKNAANTHVIAWQGRLFALWEGGLPTEIDPKDLRTLGESDLEGTIASFFSAHPHRVSAHETLYNFGLNYRGRTVTLKLYALPDRGKAHCLGSLPLRGKPIVHDFIATDTHFVFFISPLHVSLRHALLESGRFSDRFAWRPELGTEVICVPIDRPQDAVRFHVEPFFQWHFVNAFDRGRELVVDYVRFPGFHTVEALEAGAPQDMRKELHMGRYHRAVIDIARRRLHSEERLNLGVEFPRVCPNVEGTNHRFAWMSSTDSLVRLDLASGETTRHLLPAQQSVSEPMFVPRENAADELDGHVLTLCYHGDLDRSFLAVYDPHDIAAGPTARAWFDHYTPLTFHGSWVNAKERS